jgi:ABC-type Mn2+/Zn2+ transport system ATPase subunit
MHHLTVTTMTCGEPVVTLSDIQVTLDGHLALSVNRLTLKTGTSVALMGPNGSGKTTLLRLLSGLISPSKGTITGTLPAAHVTQHHDQRHWIPITAGEVITMGRYQRRGLWGRVRRSDKELIQRSAERLDVASLMRRPFGDLSGGQQQRVRIAAALAQDAACLLLDEPITGLDLPSQQIILEPTADSSSSRHTTSKKPSTATKWFCCEPAWWPPDHLNESSNLAPWPQPSASACWPKTIPT